MRAAAGPFPVIDTSAPGFHFEHPVLAELRERSWCAASDAGTLVLRHAEATELLRDRRLATSGRYWSQRSGITTGPVHDWFVRFLSQLEPADHQRLRRIVSRALQPAVLGGLQAGVRQRATTLADELSGGDPVEFVGAFSHRLSMWAMAEALGVPHEDYDLLLPWASDLAAIFSSSFTALQDRVETAAVALDAYTRELLRNRRPGDDLVSRLADLTPGGGLTEAELHNITMSLISFFHDAVSRQIARAVVTFSEHPEQWRRLSSDAGLGPAAAEEVLRWSPVVAAPMRYALHDVQYRDLRLVPGDAVLVVAPVVNRDPRAFDDPEAFDIAALRKAHNVTLGGGAYLCIGAAIVRMIIAEALVALAQRFDPPELAGPIGWQTPTDVRIETLSVRFPPRREGVRPMRTDLLPYVNGAEQSQFDSIERAIADIAAGKPVVVVDDPDRENEGDLVMAACRATPDLIGFTVRYSSGVICVPMEDRDLDRLRLPPMTAINQDPKGTAYTVSVDAKDATTTTGISARDRAHTCRLLADSSARPEQFSRPGHVFPLRAAQGGVFRRRGHTEAAVDLARLAGLPPAGVIAELVADDGSMLRVPQLVPFARQHSLAIVTIDDLVKYRRRHERCVEQLAEAWLPTRYGEFRAFGYHGTYDDVEHVALVYGDLGDGEDVLVRLHSECLTGDIVGSLRCDCGPQLESSLQRIAAEGRGVLVYLRGHEGRGIGLIHKLNAYRLQERGHDTVDANLALGLPADARDYSTGAHILADLGVRSVRLLTNNPDKQDALQEYGVPVLRREPLTIPHNGINHRYLRTKRDRMGHLLAGLDDQVTALAPRDIA